MVCTPPFSYVCPPSPHQGLADNWYQSMPVSITRVRGRDDDTCDHEVSRSHRRGGHTAPAAAAIVQHAAAALQPPYSLTGLASPLPRLVRPRAHAHTPLNVRTHTHTNTRRCSLSPTQRTRRLPTAAPSCGMQPAAPWSAWCVASGMQRGVVHQHRVVRPRTPPGARGSGTCARMLWCATARVGQCVGPGPAHGCSLALSPGSSCGSCSSCCSSAPNPRVLRAAVQLAAPTGLLPRSAVF